MCDECELLRKENDNLRSIIAQLYADLDFFIEKSNHYYNEYMEEQKK